MSFNRLYNVDFNVLGFVQSSAFGRLIKVIDCNNASRKTEITPNSL